ncbi:MAG: TIGR01777 family oxidoreductase [Bacteroidia bacterium]
MNKLILAGGTGFLGNAIIGRFRDKCSDIVVFSRGKERTDNNVRYLNWDGKTLGKWAEEISGADVVINLTGKSVDCRYNEKNKAEIISSRIDSTKILGEAIRKASVPPGLWMNAASATIYRNAEDRPMDEFTGEIGSGFSVGVCLAWEKAFNEIDLPGTRKIALRISMVMGKGGGVFPVMSKLVKNGLGGKMATGNQYVSWIHEEDILNALEWFVVNEHAEGVYNIASPDPVPNKKFMALMRKYLHRSFGLPAAKWMLEIGAFFIGTETELILKSRRVVPARLLKEGFQFRYPDADSAIKQLSNA